MPPTAAFHQNTVPELAVPFRFEVCPVQMELGVAVTGVGSAGLAPPTDRIEVVDVTVHPELLTTQVMTAPFPI